MPSIMPFRPTRYSIAQQQAEFTVWITPHLKMLYRSAWRFTGNAQDAEDLVQELLLRLYQKPATWIKLDNPTTWLIRALHNLFVDHWRRTRHTPLHNRHNLSWDDILNRVDLMDADPEHLAHSELLQRQIHTALGSLPHDQRAILVLHDMEGHTIGELSVLLKLPLGTVKSRLFRARRHLRQIFLAHGNPAGESYVLGSEMKAT
ncbi:MAG TPA: RNA polymerase sigma factor [Gammaproteobacteria bacterium]|nr:RNA polymerase sigma factor [Gammaproteobacteria bacterium]